MNDNQKIPPEVLAEIEENSRDWGRSDDDESRKIRDAEVAAYLKFRQLITANPTLPQQLIDNANEEFCWRDRTEHLEDELEVREELSRMDLRGLSETEIIRVKTDAENTHPDSYTNQREFINKIMWVESIKELLIFAERLIGNNCYNENIQNYERWGELESTGRTFRYPVRFRDGTKLMKESIVTADIDSRVLLSGSYKFGANELKIFEGIVALLKSLEERYQLDFVELERLRAQQVSA